MSVEEAFSEIERRLRNLESLSNFQQTGNIIYGSIQTPEDWFLEGEWIWIKLTAKQATSGQYFYGWKQMLRLVDPTGGYIWVESGKEGSVNEFPAIALNNDNLSVTDGRRYPARWNPDTYQWIFFLRLSSTPETDWPAGPYSCYFTLTGRTTTFPNIGSDPGCGQTSFLDMFYKCGLDPSDYPIAYIKVWVTWEGIEKLLVWETPQVVQGPFGPVVDMVNESGYLGFYDQIYFPTPTSGSVSLRWEVALNSKVDGTYKLGAGPRALRWHDCQANASDTPPFSFRNPDSVSVSGANLTGNTTTDCFFRQINAPIRVTCSADTGPPSPSGPIGGFEVKITGLTYNGAVANATGDYNQSSIDLQAEANVVISLYQNAVWNIGQTQSGNCSENNLQSINYNSTIPRVINQVSRAYHTLKLTEMPVVSTISGLTDAIVINRSLLSTCTGAGNNTYLTSLPPTDIRWHGSNATTHAYGFAEFSYSSQPSNGSVETRTPGLSGGDPFSRVSNLTSTNCKITSAWTDSWTQQFNFVSEKGTWFGGFNKSAQATGSMSVTFQIKYLL